MNRKNILLYLLSAFVGLFVLLGCSQETPEANNSSSENDEDQMTIVTSFYPVYAMTREIVGKEHPVYMIQSGAGIHGFEPSAQDVQAIYDADVFIYHSDTLESWARSVKESAEDSDTIMIEASEELELLRVPGLEDVEIAPGMDERTLYDPHTWLDPKLVADEIQYIATKLSEIDPKNAEQYAQNADEFTEEAHAIIEEYQPKFEALTQKTFVTQHTAFYYLAERFGLEQLGIAGISNEVEPSARQIAEIQDFMKEYNVQTIFVEANVSSQAADVLAAETGAEVVVLEPLEADPKNNKSYLTNLRENIEVLYQNLKRESENMK